MSTLVASSFTPAGYTRRSVRIASKTHSPTDSNLERVDVILAIADHCKEKGLEYSDTLLGEFDQWYQTYGSSCRAYSRSTQTQVATWWAKYYSHSLFYQERMLKCHEAIYRYCTKRGIQYTPQIYANFLNWYQDPANYKLVNNLPETTYTTKDGQQPCQTTLIGQPWPTAPHLVVKRFFSAQRLATN